MLSLGDLYRKQDKLDKADDILLRALTGCENELGSEHELTLAVVFSLSVLYRILDKPSEAEKMCQRALKGYENILTPMLTKGNWTRQGACSSEH